MAGDKMYQAMKEIAKSKGIKASPQHDMDCIRDYIAAQSILRIAS